MADISAAAVRAFVLEHVAAPLSALGLSPESVPDDFDLLSQGVIDSFGLIELIGEVEDRFGLELDLDEMDPEAVTLVGSFARFVEDQSAGAEAV